MGSHGVVRRFSDKHTQTEAEFLRSKFIQRDFPGEQLQEPEPQPRH